MLVFVDVAVLFVVVEVVVIVVVFAFQLNKRPLKSAIIFQISSI